MAKSKDIHDPENVTAFIQKLEPEFAKLIIAIRSVILETNKEIGEQIKWNSPSFFYTGEMKSFDPKEYKRDIIVVHTRKNEALLVFPTGAVIEDTTGLLGAAYSDGRRMVKFISIEEFNSRQQDLKTVIANWISKIDIA